MVIYLEQGADLHMSQLMPLPLIVSCFSKIQIGFAFLVLAHPGSPGQRAVKQVCVCVTFEHTLTQSECFLSTFIEHFKLFFLQTFRLCLSLQRLKCYGSVQCLQ